MERFVQVINKLTGLISISLRSLLDHKLRSALSSLGIICGVMAVLTMISIGEGAKHDLLSQIEQLGTKNIYLKQSMQTDVQKERANNNLSVGLTPDDVQRIRQGYRNITNIGLLTEVSATVFDISSDISPQIIAVSSNYSDIMGLDMAEGRFISAMDVQNREPSCVLGASIALNLGLKGKTGAYLRIENQLFKVVGRIKSFERKGKEDKKAAISIRNYNDIIFIPFGLDSLISHSRAGGKFLIQDTVSVSEIIVQVNDSDLVMSAGKSINRIVNIAHNGVSDFQVIIPRELLRQARRTQRLFNLILGAIAGISLLVGGIGIMNIMLASVYERTREIGIRRAVGATRLDIVWHFLTESIILTSVGGLVGVFMGIVTSVAVAKLGQWQTLITAWAILLPVLMAIFVGIFFGIYPALQASKMDPIKALRHE
jgi:putative ABC transport system permease protein